MKVSVSLPDEDVEFLDAYARSQGLASRSATVHKAVRLLARVRHSAPTTSRRGATGPRASTRISGTGQPTTASADAPG